MLTHQWRLKLIGFLINENCRRKAQKSAGVESTLIGTMLGATVPSSPFARNYPPIGSAGLNGRVASSRSQACSPPQATAIRPSGLEAPICDFWRRPRLSRPVGLNPELRCLTANRWEPYFAQRRFPAILLPVPLETHPTDFASKPLLFTPRFVSARFQKFFTPAGRRRP